MKKFVPLITVLVIAMALVLGCPAPNGDPAGDLGDTFTLSGELKKETHTSNESGPDSYTYNASPTTSGKVVASTGDEGAISNGSFSIDISVPATADLAILTKEDVGGDNFESVTISPAGVKYVELSLTVGSEDLENKKTTVSGSNNESDESVSYMYVDADVTVTLKGKESSDEFFGYTWVSKTNDATLELKKGWNAVYYLAEGEASETAASYNISISLSAKTLEWVLED
jgi:hypothetical protein